MKSSGPSPNSRIRHHGKTRRNLIAIGVLALVYPFLRFIGYNVPRKPRTIEINSQPSVNGIILNNEFILFDQGNRFWAVSRKCTHLGCKVNFHEQGNYLECPCHQSRFSPNGDVIRGPAKDKLAVYSVEKRDTAPYYIITV